MPKLQKLPDEINGFKIIKDLGFLCSSNAKQKFRACIAICPKCYKEFQSRPTDLRKIESCLCGRILKEFKDQKRLRSIFKDMVKRCNNTNHQRYARYGGRGIKVCDQWLGSTNSFLDWANKNGYLDTLSIDRINNDFGYSPENCRWVGYEIQMQNSAKATLNASQVLEIRAMHPEYSYSKIADIYKVNKSTIANVVLRKTWSNI